MVKDSIRVSLELFEGPLDLLLHLIQIRHIDIIDIPISDITSEYLETLELMQEMDLDIAGEYLVMASTLILIKSRTLLPPAASDDMDIEDEDPRKKLIERLKQYQIYREAGKYFQDLNKQQEEHFHRGHISKELKTHTDWIIDATLIDLMRALKEVINRQHDGKSHIVVPNPISVRERMTEIVKTISSDGSLLISQVFGDSPELRDIIATFLAVLELIRMQVIQARQRKQFGDIRLSIISEEEI